MDVPTQLPDLLPSPTTTIKLRAGDSLDFATLLCSLLRGSGFNAYVVSGYAPKSVTLCDETLVECPFIGSEEEDFLGLQLADEKAAQEQYAYFSKRSMLLLESLFLWLVLFF